MKKENILPFVLLVISIILTIVSYVILPDTVVIQFGTSTEENSTAPKMFAVLIPALFSIGGSIALLMSKEKQNKNKSLILAVVGLVLFLFTIIVNVVL